MRKPFIAGNWKMNLASRDAREAARKLLTLCADLKDVEIAVAPTFTSLSAVLEILRGSPIGIAAQNCHPEVSGAFTGEVSAEMIKELGCTHVILGHSERRQYFDETDDGVNRKLVAAFRANLLPIVCIGESLAEREAGQTMAVVERQLKGALMGVPAERFPGIVIAYEPVWAIGTGKTATSDQAQEVHGFLRKLLGELSSPALAAQVRIQYGGSVKPENIAELMAKPDIDGALVGGASLKPEGFATLLHYQR